MQESFASTPVSTIVVYGVAAGSPDLLTLSWQWLHEESQQMLELCLRDEDS